MNVLTRLLAVLFIASFSLTAVAQDRTEYPRPAYSNGLYGYKLKNDWKIPPLFESAKPYSNGLAPVSFDGKKYALMNIYGGIVTDFIFDTPPADFYDGISRTQIPGGDYYFVNLAGEKISPYFKYARQSGPLIIASPDNLGYNIYDYNFNSRGATPYKSLTQSAITLEGESASYLVAEKIDGSATVLDWEGSQLMGDRYCEVKQINHYLNNDKGLKKLFDKAFFYGGENILAIVKSAANGCFGVVSLAGTEIVPCTYPTEKKLTDNLKKLSKDKLIPYLRRNAKNDIATLGTAMKESKERLRRSNLASLKTPLPTPESMNTVMMFCSVVDKNITSKTGKGKSKSAGKSTKKTLYYLSDDYTPKGDPFTKLEQLGYYFIGTKQGEKKSRLYNIYGLPVGDPYDNIRIWGYNSDNIVMFMVSENGKWGLINSKGKQLLPIEYDRIDITSQDTKLVAASRGGKQYAVNGQTGHLLSTIAYDEINTALEKNGLYPVRRLGYETKIDAGGKENPSIPHIVFNKIEQLPQDAFDKRIEGYKNCITLCTKDNRDILGLCYNNMGVMFIKKGDTATARQCYEKGASYGNSTASSNLAAIKQNERQEKLNAVGEFLNNMNEVLNGGSGGYGASGSNAYTPTGNNGTSEPSSGSSSSKRDLSYYQSMYQRWERQAKSNYESLTRAGVRVKNNGKDTGGSAGGSWRPQNYTGLKKLLRESQSEMKKIRQEARRDGYNIPQSNYETVTVSY